MLVLMFKKRSERLTRLSEEIEKQRGEYPSSASTEAPSEQPRRVDNFTMFQRIHEMQKKGGSGNVPLC
jgi:hypothetical protein